MQRKMQLIRKILQAVESADDEIPVPEFVCYTESQVHYHVGLCQEAGYIVVGKPSTYEVGRRFPSIERLTWAGHEALDSLRNGS